ncbi:MAG TPA: hypothetical protein PKM59_16175 [Thermodesulfobacteriota bacterium]|nr:hypothetical protein [Thermodesulfobacteriota bacterium]
MVTINITALMKVRELVGWSSKAIEFEGRTLVDFLKHVVTQDGRSLHDVFVQEDGTIHPDYAVWMNCRPIRPQDRLEIPLQSGDRVIAMPVMKFRAGG